MTTSTDYFEVATVPNGTLRPDSDEHDLMVMLAATIAPSDLPAAELPYFEPTGAELLAIELFDETAIDGLFAAANTFAAYEASRFERLGLPASASLPGTSTALGGQLTTLGRAA
jgi:hypothetical protein